MNTRKEKLARNHKRPEDVTSIRLLLYDLPRFFRRCELTARHDMYCESIYCSMDDAASVPPQYFPLLLQFIQFIYYRTGQFREILT